MVNIICVNSDCKHNKDLQCTKEQIVVNSDVVCNDFEFKTWPDEEVEDDKRD